MITRLLGGMIELEPDTVVSRKAMGNRTSFIEASYFKVNSW